ncbi:MAG: glycosyltransferase family 4 protein [Nanoarchaeota archaeon]|nr:glycosyltransferase family 4 protein [Nanoarchaeota archaeon]
MDQDRRSIIFVGGHRKPLTRVSTDAVDKVTLNLADGMSALGYKVHIVSLRPETPSVSGPFLYSYIDASFPGWLKPFIFYIRACMQIRKINARYVHFNVGLPGILSWMTGGRITIRCFHNRPGEYGSNPFFNVYSFLNSLGDRNFSVYLSVSQYVKESVDQQYNRKPSFILYNSVDTKKYVPGKKKKGRIFYSGRVVPEKGVEELILAFSKIRNHKLKLRIAGPYMLYTHSKFSNDIFSIISKDRRIEYLGVLDEKRLIREYQEADIFCYPVKWEECFGVSLLEAQFCGARILTTRRGGIPEIAYGAEYVEPSTESIQEGISRMIGMPSNKQRRIGQDKFSIAAVAAKYDKILQSVRN